MLREEDRAFLERRGWKWEAREVEVNGGRELHVVIHDFPLPDKYRPRQADILVRIRPGYPEVGMDMFWTRPEVTLAATGSKPNATEVYETYEGVSWQRWSRHIGTWRPGVDGLETFFAAIIRELNR